MKRFTMKKKIIAGAAAAALVAGIGGAAFAYFTSTGSGTGNGQVGSATNFTVTVAAYTGSANLYPGTGSQNVTYTVTNSGSGDQLLTSTSAALTADVNGDVFDTTANATAVGCKASWFTVTNHQPTTPAVPATLAGGASATGGNVDLSMPSNSTDNQDPCQGVTPQITVSATS
jgi:hypothetical protein